MAYRQRLVAIIEDDREVAENHARLLSELELRSVILTDPRDVDRTLGERPDIELALVDIRMPHMDGIDVLSRISCTRPDIGVIMVTVLTDIEYAVRATKSGAFNYLLKPLTASRLKGAIDAYFESRSRPPLGDPRFSSFVTQSQQFEELFRRILSFSVADVTVLVEGETGTGKEVVARLIHACSARAAQPFVAVNLAAIPNELVESELFGHVRGAFTGALTSRRGLFEQAERGTLFIDEFGDASPEVQKKLLRVLQERAFRPVGSENDRPAGARVVVATNKLLAQEMRTGHFRSDLYFRVAPHAIKLPPLRHRREDIPLLAEYFLKKYRSQYGRNISGIHPRTIECLLEYDFPGNVRELEGMMSAAVLLEQCAVLMPSSLPDAVQQPDVESTDLLTSRRARVIFQALADCDGNQTRAASQLGISRETLNRVLKKYRFQFETPDLVPTLVPK